MPQGDNFFSNDIIDNHYAEHRLRMRQKEAEQVSFSPEDPGVPGWGSMGAGQAPGKIGQYGKDIAKSIPHGFMEAITNTVDSLGALSASLDLHGTAEDPFSFEQKSEHIEGELKNPLEGLAPETLPGQLSGGIVQFLTGFVPYLKIFRSLGAAGIIGEMGAGMVADATVFKPFQENLANLVDKIPPQLKNPFLEYLAKPVRVAGEAMEIEEDDTRAEAMLKRVAEGTLMGAMVEPFMWAARTLKRSGIGETVAAQVGQESIQKTGKSLLQQADEVLNVHLDNGGSSINLRTGENLFGTDAIALSIYEGRQVKVPGQATREQIAGYIDMNKDLLLGPDQRVNLGTWYNPEEGVTYLDVIATVPREQIEAVHELGRAFDQKAAFDLYTGREIPLAGTGQGIASGIPEAERLAMVPTASTGTMKLQRYQGQEGLTELDPTDVANYTGVSAAEQGRLQDVLGKEEVGAPHRLNYYLEGATHEPQVQQGRFLYETEIPRGRLYNVGLDPLNLREKATLEGMVRPEANVLESMIREHGYAGYINPVSELKTAAIWEKLPVKQIERELPMAQAADAILEEARVGRALAGYITEEGTEPLTMFNTIDTFKELGIEHMAGSPEGGLKRDDVFVSWTQAEPQGFRKAVRPLVDFLINNPDINNVAFIRTEAIDRWADRLGAVESEGLWRISRDSIAKFLKTGKDLLKSEKGFLAIDKKIPQAEANRYAAVGAAYLAQGKRPFNKWVKGVSEIVGPENGMVVREAAEKRFENWVKKTATWQTRTKHLMEYFKNGEHGIGWYEGARPELEQIFGNDTDMFVKFLAATSPGVSVRANQTLALKAYWQWVKSGRDIAFYDFKGFTGTHRDNLRKAVGGFEMSGPKVQNFEKALNGDLDAVVVDRWMVRAFGLGKDSPTELEYLTIEQMVRHQAEKLGIKPAEYQEAVWIGIKTLKQGRDDTVEPFQKIIKEWLDHNPHWVEDLGLNYTPPQLALEGITAERKFLSSTGANVVTKKFPPEKATQLGLFGNQSGLTRRDLNLVLARLAAGALAGGSFGETPEDRIRNAAIGMGITGITPVLIKKLASVVRSARSESRELIEDVPEAMAKTRPASVGAEAKNWDELVGMHRVPEEVQGTWNEFNALVDTFDWRTTKAKRGEVRPREYAHWEGEQLGWTLDDVKKMAGPFNMTDEQASALINVMRKSGQQVIDSAKKWLETQAPEDMNTFLKQYNAFLEMDPKRLAAKAEAGRSLGILNEPLSGMNRFLEQFSPTAEYGAHVGPNRLAQMVAALEDPERLARAFHHGARPGMKDVLLELWINGLLSGIVTHSRNFLGNTITAFWAMPERAIASRIGKSVHKGEATAMFFGMMQSVTDAWKMAARAFEQGHPVSGLSKIETRFRKAISSEAFGMEGGTWASFIDYMGEVVRLPGRFLLAGDEFGKVINSRMQTYALAYREGIGKGLKGKKFADYIKANLDNMPSKIKEAADEFAAVQTFTNELGGFGRALTGLSESTGFARIIMPFVKTPVNIFKYVTERVPVTAPFYKEVRADIRAGGVRRDMALAKMSTGALTLAMFGTLAGAGLITGRAPKNKVLRQAWEADGKREYSMYIPVLDKWVSYKGTDPIGMFIGLAADFVTGVQQSDKETAGEWATAVAGALWAAFTRNLSSKTYLKGVADFVEVVSSEEPDKAERWLRNFTGSFVPSIVAQAARQIDPIQREAHSITEKWLSRTPWLSQTVAPARNIFGEVQEFTGALGPDWVSPFYSSARKKPDAIMREIEKNETEAEMPPWAVNGIKLSSKQRDQWITLMNEIKSDDTGNTMKEELSELIKSEEYKEATPGPDGMKSEMIKHVIYIFKKMALLKLRDKDSELDRRLREQEVEDLQNRYGDNFNPQDYMEALGR